MSDVLVYRAPMRSRRDDVPPEAAVRRGLALGLVGVGGVLTSAPGTVHDAVRAVALEHDDRTARRLQRFVDMDEGAFVWTRDPDVGLHLGRVLGPWSYDDSSAARSVDLVHVRSCEWASTAIDAALVPDGVRATFARGGRNFQQTHTPGVVEQTARVWDLIS